MSKYRTIQRLSEARFGVILDKLLNDKEFREAFFAESRDTLKQFGIKLTKKEIERFKNLEWSKDKYNIVDFNEKLVLCSSSGY